MACLLWCHLFNNYKDPVHYKKLFGDDKLKPLSPAFATYDIKARLLNAASLDDASYAAYREQVTAFRDKYVAHREYLQGSIAFPNLTTASAMIRELRVVLEETVREELRLHPDDPILNEIALYYEDHQNNSVILGCSSDAEDAIQKCKK